MEKIWDEAFLRKVDREIERVRRKLEVDKELRRLVSRYRTLGTVLTREMLKKGLRPDMKIEKSKEYMELEEMLDAEFNKGNKNPRWDNVYMYTDCGIFWFYNIGCEVGNKSVCIDQVTLVQSAAQINVTSTTNPSSGCSTRESGLKDW